MSIDRLRAHWGFSRTPFTKELAPSMLFASGAHREAVARITWIVGARAIGVICAEVGAVHTVAARGPLALRALRNEWTKHIEEHPEELSKFPEQMGKAVAANALHPGGDENTPVDPDKQCYPSGQGGGAIDQLRPPGAPAPPHVAAAGPPTYRNAFSPAG